MNIGIIGAGAIAQFLIKELPPAFTVCSMLVRDKEKVASFITSPHVAVYTTVDGFLASPIDIVIEAATIEAASSIVPTVLAKKPVIIMSVGVLADEAVRANLQAISTTHGHAIYIPSGAIGGIDVLQNAASLGAVTAVHLTTCKPAASLGASVTEPTVIFDGNAAQAIAKYPKNMNVSIILALAGIGFEKTHVTVIADPQAQVNKHDISIYGDFGTASMTFENEALAMNPKTSYLAALSVIGTLKNMKQAIRFQ